MNMPIPTAEIDTKGQQLAVEAEAILKVMQEMPVENDQQYQHAANELQVIKGKFKEIDGHRVFLKEPHLDGCKRVDGFFKPVLNFLEEAEKIVKKKLGAYQAKLEEERLRLQREAEERARKEREELERKAREAREKAEREAAEIRRKAEEEAAAIRRKAEEEAAAGRAAEAARLAEQAAASVAKAEEKAETKVAKAEEKSQTLQEQATSVVVSTVVREAPKVAGLSYRKVWKHRIVDQKQLPREYMIPNDKMLADFAEATKGAIPVAGVEFYSENVPASKATTRR